MTETHPVIIFWDVQNVGISDLKPTYKTYMIPAIQQFAKKYGNVVDFRAFYSGKHVSSHSRHHFLLSGVTSCVVPELQSESVDNALLVDMMLFAVDNPAPATVILISQDGDFTIPLHRLRKYNYKTIVIVANHSFKKELKQAADEFFMVDAIIHEYAELKKLDISEKGSKTKEDYSNTPNLPSNGRRSSSAEKDDADEPAHKRRKVDHSNSFENTLLHTLNSFDRSFITKEQYIAKYKIKDDDLSWI